VNKEIKPDIVGEITAMVRLCLHYSMWHVSGIVHNDCGTQCVLYTIFVELIMRCVQSVRYTIIVENNLCCAKCVVCTIYVEHNVCGTQRLLCTICVVHNDCGT